MRKSRVNLEKECKLVLGDHMHVYKAYGLSGKGWYCASFYQTPKWLGKNLEDAFKKASRLQADLEDPLELANYLRAMVDSWDDGPREIVDDIPF